MLTMVVLPVAAQQRGKVTATLVDAKSGAGVPGAVVEVAPAAKPDNKKYYTTGYGGKVEISNLAYGDYKMVVTFLFDSVYMWCVNVLLAFLLSRFTSMSFVWLYALVQISTVLKCGIGVYLVKKGFWIKNIVSEE